MLRVGLTGGIACGKTVVRKLFADRGAFTIDADHIVHQLLSATSDLARQVSQKFGGEVVAPDGSIDRKRLGAIVFSDPAARQWLNRLVHPRVISEQKRLVADAERRGESLAVVDAALMIETGTYREYDRLVVVHCPRELQIDRLRERDGLSSEGAAQRVDAQLAVEKKKAYADHLVDTSGSLDDTERQVQEIWDDLQREAAGG
jgi:dephospho-CoA kinase